MPRPRLAAVVLALAVLVFLTSSSPSAPGGAGNGPAYVPGEILVGFHPGAKALDRAGARASLNAVKMRAFRSGAEHWRLGAGVGVEQAIQRLRDNPRVRFAEPNYLLSVDLIPNDPRLGELYGLINTGQSGGTPDADIDADMAWGVSTGDHGVIVGVIDTGCDYNHPDLAANIWTNPGEIPGNSIDDDNNGFVDDVHGYDFYNNDGDPFDDNGHGTHVSGTIGGVGNNGVGVVGVNWNVSIMCIKFLSAGGSGSTAGAISSVDYSVAMGVDLTSNSWGGGGFSQALMDAIAAADANEQLFIAAAGNSNTNNDVTPHYPSSYNVPNIIAVAATDRNDAKASFSSYGATSVDLGAPGVDILSTLPGNSYGTLSGTSMATPHVSGVAALVRSLNPAIPAAQVKQTILNHVDPKPSMAGITVTGGRLNAFFSIATPDTDPPAAITDLATNNPGSNTMGLSWTAVGDDGMTGTATFYQVRYSTSPIDEMSWAAATRAGNEPNPGPAGAAESMEVRGLAADTSYYFAIKSFDEWGNPGPISNLASGTTQPPPTVSVTPTSVSRTLFTGQAADANITLSNAGVGTLDWSIPTPALGEPMSVPPAPLILGKDDPDPRFGDPVTEGSGGPDAFGYRWSDSDEPGGPAFSWVEISGTGTPVAVTGDDATSAPIALSFNFPFYGNFFNSFRVSTNGFLSFTSTSTAYSNQPLPNSGAPENLVAPFWDDLNPGAVQRIYFQDLGTQAVVQWNAVPPYSGTGTYTFQAILDASGAITYQYLSMTGAVNSATVGIQNAARTIGLQVAFNQTYIHDNLAVRIAAIPQWLTASPTSGRLTAGQSVDINLHMDASGLEGGTYPGVVNILNNDPNDPTATVDVSLHVVGAPDAAVQPASLAYGDTFQGLPKNLTLTVANIGTDTLHVTGIVPSHPGELSPSPSSFNVPPHGSQSVTVTWVPAALGPFTGSLTVQSDDAGEPAIVVPVTGNGIAPPVVVIDPNGFEDTLFSGNQSNHDLVITNAGGSNLNLTLAADLGTGGSGIATTDPSVLGQGGPDGFGYRWRDSDAPGGPAFNFIDISATGTPLPMTGDDNMSPTVNMGMTFPFYGVNYTQVKVCTNGFITFNTATTSCPFTNGTLPSTSLPKPSIALFWDDLHFRGAQRARYLYDGTRFIVQYTGVDRITAGSSLTFQVQLYPDGRVLVMYATMNSPLLTSATIGIQNHLTSPNHIALQVVSNAAYMHSNLALQFSRVPDWLRVAPASATIPPGGDANFIVTFDSTSRPGGTLTGNVVVGTNIPGQQTILLPATLHVIGAPQIALAPASHHYGTVFVGYPQLTSFQILNNGTDILNVSDVDTTDPNQLSVEEPPSGNAAFPVPPGGSRVMNLRWLPMSAGSLSAAVRVYSDDPVTPVAMLPVDGNAIVPPLAAHAPSSFTKSMMVGDVEMDTLHLENNGGSGLTFSVAVRALGGTPVTQHPELELKKDEPDPRPGLLGSGGPDLFGYRWRDSDDPAGPTFSWTDISSIGTPISSLTGDDQNAAGIPIGFPFPYHGSSFTTVNVCTNGWLSFTSTSTDLSNSPLPNTGEPENIIAAFWDDLHFRSAARARYHNDGTRFILQYTDVDRFSTSEQPSPAHLTFQIILYPSGRFVFQYLTMTGFLTSATIGEQNATRNDGLTVVHNAPYMHDNLAIEFRPPLDFLSVSPASGSLPAPPDPNNAIDLDVRIDATNLIGGDYAASIDLITNDPTQGLISVPLNLHVTGIPDIDAAPPSLDFPTTFVGFGSSLPLTIKNAGTDVLHIASASISGDFSMIGPTTPVSLPVNGTIPVTVTFAPITDGTRTGNLTIDSDDPDEDPLVIPLSGEGLFPPVIGVAPSSISTALPPGGSRTKTETICNTGGSVLNWSAGTDLIDRVVTPYSALELAKGEDDPRIGILGSGGPDMFGYRWKDSDEAGGPVFSWTDISGTGTPITALTGDDQNSGSIPIGFPFPFYGNVFSDVRVTTNGWLSFTSSATTFTNQPLPSSGSGVPENLLAVYWDDLHFRGTVRARYHNDGSRFIVQYTDVDRFSTSDLPSPAHLTFQVILYPSGKIVYQYLTMTGFLTSATIGIQNAARNDGLQVVFNAAYMHDNLAIEFKPLPDWIQLSPTGGSLQVGDCQDVTVLLNAAGLDDGLHHGFIEFSSNDPYTPLVPVPVTLNVGLVSPTMVEFDPDVLNLSSNGNTVKVLVELPSPYDIQDVAVGSMTLNDAVPANLSPVSYNSDLDRDRSPEIAVKFDRSAVEAILPEGPSVQVCVQFEITDVQWFRGCTDVRAIRPQVTAPGAGSYFLAGEVVPIRWTEPAWGALVTYRVHLSRDGGDTWEELAAGVSGGALDWTATEPMTGNARVRVLAFDNQGLLGYDVGDGAFSISGSALTPPRGVADLDADFDGVNLILTWKAPAADGAHGPADRYRVERSDAVQGPFNEVAVVTATSYSEPAGSGAPGTMTFYKVIAANAAGDAP
jgi:subtilisin family serine protease